LGNNAEADQAKKNQGRPQTPSDNLHNSIVTRDLGNPPNK
jgi:hypothetical protein